MKRTPLARVSPRRAAKRRTAAQKKALRPERYCASPEHPRCIRPVVRLGMCGTHSKEHLDRLLRRVIVKPETGCEMVAWHADRFPCRGGVQVCHLAAGRAYLVVRWEVGNVLPGCAAINLWAEDHPLEWTAMLRDWLGVTAVDAIVARALSGEKPDYDAIHADLHSRLGEREEERAA